MPAHEGSRDLDFLIGDWDVRVRRPVRPLSGSQHWVEFEGTATCRPVRDGRANLDEFTVLNRSDGRRIEGLTLRLFSPQKQEWNVYWANSRDGTLGTPQVGRFEGGRGEFYDWDVFEDTEILVRYPWTDITENSCRFEQAFSTDEGKTWETNWTSTQTRRGASQDPR